jgi:prenyl protein peptidase
VQGNDWQTLIFATPLFFGLCHLHHGWGMVQWYGWSWRIPVLCCVQFLYTTVFGWYATWVFLATGSTAAAVLVHSLCNWMGLPAFGQMSRAHGLACVAGVAAFCWVAPRALRPSPSSAFWWRPCAAEVAGGV